jgi:DNA-binding transcriptional ArsR family regulator
LEGEKQTKSELPPVKERLKNLNEQDLKILKYLVDHYRAGGQAGNPVFVKQIMGEFRDLAHQTIVGILKKLENRRLIESGEKAGEAGFIYAGERKIKLYWIVNKETYRKLKKLLP